MKKLIKKKKNNSEGNFSPLYKEVIVKLAFINENIRNL
jgi:hypothetical protein